MCIEFLEYRYARRVGQMQVKQDADRRAVSRSRALGVRKATHAVAGERENDRQGVAHHFIVVDDEQIVGRPGEVKKRRYYNNLRYD
jgi:hypothetical protein